MNRNFSHLIFISRDGAHPCREGEQLTVITENIIQSKPD